MAGKRLFSANRGVADLIHFTEGRFSTSPAYIGSTNRSIGRWWGAQLFDFTSDYYEPDGSNVHLEGDLRLN